MKVRHYILTAMAACCITAAGQENVSVQVSPSPERQSNFNLTPEAPSLTGPSANQGYTSPLTPSLDITHMSLTDSIVAYNAGSNMGTMQPAKPQYGFRMDPYSADWSRGGIMAMPGGGFLVGNGSYSAMPALGNTGTASLTWVQPLGDRLMVSVGASGNKYHFDRHAWNDYSVFANARFSINEHFAVKAWGSYYAQPLFHSMAAMPYVGSSNYGASLDMRMNNLLGLELGAQRTYDPFSRRWNTVPVIAPKFYIAGSPISIDFGGLLKNMIDSRNNQLADPMKPMDMNGPKPPGFNPHSPVRIPDAHRR